MNRLTLTLLILTTILGVSFAAYDEQLATQLAHASQASYCKSDILKTFKCGINCDYLKGYQTIDYKEYKLFLTTVSYTTFVNPTTKRLVVAFRGTNSVIQLFKEVTFSKAAKCPFCTSKNAKISQYFIYFYDNVFKADFMTSMAAIAKKYPNFDFYITGHSLGGAFATIAALHLSHMKIFPAEKLSLYTFGSPRVGNRAFALEVTASVKQSYRVVHSNDIVPHVPPKDMDCNEGDLFYGWHVANEIYYNDDFTSYKVCKGEEDMSCSNSVSLLSLRVSDHLVYMGARSPCISISDFIALPSFSDLKNMMKVVRI